MQRVCEVSTFKPLLRHCRSFDVWKVRRTSSPEMGGKVWPDFSCFLRDEHPDWLDPATKEPPDQPPRNPPQQCAMEGGKKSG